MTKKAERKKVVWRGPVVMKAMQLGCDTTSASYSAFLDDDIRVLDVMSPIAAVMAALSLSAEVAAREARLRHG